MPDQVRNFFVLVDHIEVKQKTISQAGIWLEILGNSLKDIATKQLNLIIRDTNEYRKQLGAEMGGIDSLKHLLNTISEIKNKSMDMEFRINEVQEQFRILKMYKFPVEEELQVQVDSLSTNWIALLDEADRKDFEVNDFKKNFAEVTKGEVLKFKNELKEEFERYIQNGPGADHVGLEEGVELLNQSKDCVRRFNKRREEYVLAEKLFNLPISKFPELISMEEDNKKFDDIY
jgi:dynein heavy chain